MEGKGGSEGGMSRLKGRQVGGVIVGKVRVRGWSDGGEIESHK